MSIAKVALPLLGVLAVAVTFVVLLGCGPEERAELDTPAVPPAGIPPIDAAAPTETETATLALG
ncbi:MAG: hypothetical protein ACP5JJ_05845 [Anaerolineae bacterium]